MADIFKNWRNRSNDGRYNALLTTHVGGGKASTPMAMMYFKEFQRINEIHRQNNKPTLKVAVTFSQDSSNGDSMLSTNEGLSLAMETYNQEFGTSFGMDDVSGYTQDVTSRLNKTATDGHFLDLVIVIDQLLTGFDAPEMNTLYVDRTLKGASLIQAYSRCNRIADMQEKPWGRIVNYRWPAQNEKLMNQALAIYANKDSANLSERDQKESNEEDGIIAKPFEKTFSEVQTTVDQLREATADFQQLPPSEKKKEEMLDLLRDYNVGMAKLKQYNPEEVDGTKVGFDYSDPDELIGQLGMSADQETMLTSVLTNELKTHLAQKQQVPVAQIELRMTHVKDIQVNYDYLTELVERLLNQVHDGKDEAAKSTQTEINKFANALENRDEAASIINAAIAIIDRIFPPVDSKMVFPVRLSHSEDIIQQANNVSIDRVFLDFRNKWGITDIITSAAMRELFGRHRYEAQDLDDNGRIRDIIAKASASYQNLAIDPEVQALSKIKYRNGLRRAIYSLADQMVRNA